MKNRLTRWISVLAFLPGLSEPARLAAQELQDQQPPRYTLIDLGTLGGRNSLQNSPGRALSNDGAAIGGADLPIPDPYAPGCLQLCFVNHAFVWQKGILKPLGFPAGVDS